MSMTVARKLGSPEGASTSAPTAGPGAGGTGAGAGTAGAAGTTASGTPGSGSGGGGGAIDRVRRAKDALESAKERARVDGEARTKDRARDQELVDKARAGDAAAFRKLVESHQARLFAVAYGMLRDRDDAMDVVQDAFIKAH